MARSFWSGPRSASRSRARATAEAAYKRGAKFVDVAYFDPYVKRARIENAARTRSASFPSGMANVCSSTPSRMARRINLRGVTAPNLMDGLDKSLLGKDTLPTVKETAGLCARVSSWAHDQRCLRGVRLRCASKASMSSYGG